MDAGRIFTTATISTTSTNSYNSDDKENKNHHHWNHPCLEPWRIFWEDQCSFFFFNFVPCQSFDVSYIVVHKPTPCFSSHLRTFLLGDEKKNDNTSKIRCSPETVFMISFVLFKCLFLVICYIFFRRFGHFSISGHTWNLIMMGRIIKIGHPSNRLVMCFTILFLIFVCQCVDINQVTHLLYCFKKTSNI